MAWHTPKKGLMKRVVGKGSGDKKVFFGRYGVLSESCQNRLFLMVADVGGIFMSDG